jgi:hypothetical protein
MSSLDHPENASSSTVTPVTCFLSSAVSDRELANEVCSVLTELGIDVQTADHLPPGSDIGSSIINAVLSTAFVCIVLGDAPPLPAIMFEAGIAAGSRRPLLIVASPEGASQLPADLLSAPIIRYQGGSKDHLRDSLNAYLKNVQPIAEKLTLNWDALVDEEQEAQSREPTIHREQSIVAQIASHLDHIGAFVAVGSRIGSGRADIVATFPTLGESFNPVIIEVKRYVSNADSDLQQIGRYLREANARLGLIVYGKDTPRRIRTTGSTGILLLSAGELMSWDGDRTVREITKLRNQVVHSA